MLGASWSPCCRSPPPAWTRRASQLRRSMRPSPSGCGLGLRGFALSGPPLRSLAVRPGDSLAIPRLAVSMGSRGLVSLTPTIQATGRLAVTPAGLPPAERASLHWTHHRTCGVPASGCPRVTVRHSRRMRNRPMQMVQAQPLEPAGGRAPQTPSDVLMLLPQAVAELGRHVRIYLAKVPVSVEPPEVGAPAPKDRMECRKLLLQAVKGRGPRSLKRLTALTPDLPADTPSSDATRPLPGAPGLPALDSG